MSHPSRALLALALALALPGSIAWGRSGHEVAGLIASQLLSEGAEQYTTHILGNETLQSGKP